MANSLEMKFFIICFIAWCITSLPHIYRRVNVWHWRLPNV